MVGVPPNALGPSAVTHAQFARICSQYPSFFLESDMPQGKGLKVKIAHVDMILMCPIVDSTYTFHSFQEIKGIAPVCVLDSNAIRFLCVLPVCRHPKEHVVLWYHKHGIPFMATFGIVATLYSVVVHHNIWNLSFQQCFLNSIWNKWSIIIRIRSNNRWCFQCEAFHFPFSSSFLCCWCHRCCACHWCYRSYRCCACHWCCKSYGWC